MRKGSYSEVWFLVIFACIWPKILGPEAWPRFASIYIIQSHFPLCIAKNSQHRSLLTAIGQKKASSHLLVFTRDTRNEDREKNSGQTHLFNIWTIGAMDRTSGQPQVKLSLLRRISNTACVFADAGGNGPISAKTTSECGSSYTVDGLRVQK